MDAAILLESIIVIGGALHFLKAEAAIQAVVKKIMLTFDLKLCQIMLDFFYKPAKI